MSIQINKSILQKSISFLTVFAIGFIFALSAQAASFTITNGQTVTTSQTLDGAGEIGVIEEGGELNTSADAITIMQANANLLLNEWACKLLNDYC